MISNDTIKKVALWSAVVMLTSFAIAATIFFQSGGKDNLKDKTNNYCINYEKSQDVKNIKDITINTASTDINIITEEREDIKAHLYGSAKSFTMIKMKSSKKPELIVESQGDKINIEVDEGSNVGIGVGYFNSNIKLDVYLPKKYSENLKIAASSGRIKVNNLSIKELNVSSTSGDKQLENLTINSGEIKGSSGRQELSNINVNENFEVNTTSGDVNLKTITCKKVDFKASSGRIDISNFEGNIGLRSSSGDISIDYRNFNNNEIEAETSSGRVRLKMPKKSAFDLRIKTSSGNIKNEFTLDEGISRGEHELQGNVNGGKNPIKLSTSSGDVEILN